MVLGQALVHIEEEEQKIIASQQQLMQQMSSKQLGQQITPEQPPLGQH